MIKKFISLAAVVASIFGCSGSDTVAADDDHIASGVKKGTMTDPRDGHKYKTVTIGTQTWMAENLNYDPDPGDVFNIVWSGCYGNESANCSKFGRLYTWDIAMNKADCALDKTCNASLNPTIPVRGVCPQGWHLPSYYEFVELINFVDSSFESNGGYAFSTTVGKYLKSQSGWFNHSETTVGTDSYGFSALPGGHRKGGFFDEGRIAYFWSASESGDYSAYRLSLYYDEDRAVLDDDGKSYGFSVRCVQN